MRHKSVRAKTPSLQITVKDWERERERRDLPIPHPPPKKISFRSLFTMATSFNKRTSKGGQRWAKACFGPITSTSGTLREENSAIAILQWLAELRWWDYNGCLNFYGAKFNISLFEMPKLWWEQNLFSWTSVCKKRRSSFLIIRSSAGDEGVLISELRASAPEWVCTLQKIFHWRRRRKGASLSSKVVTHLVITQGNICNFP